MQSKNKVIITVSVFLLLFLVGSSLFIGNYKIEFLKGIALLFRRGDVTSLDYKVLWTLRFPRVIMAIIIGMLLGSSGAIT
ncbi:MAG: iron chelate uptake ABC transporter family permease subunit, partial [Paraclostridium dentum]